MVVRLRIQNEHIKLGHTYEKHIKHMTNTQQTLKEHTHNKHSKNTHITNTQRTHTHN